VPGAGDDDLLAVVNDSIERDRLVRLPPRCGSLVESWCPGSDFTEVRVVGKASRNRRQKKDQERQRRREGRASGLGWSPGRPRVPSQTELVVAAVSGAVDAVCQGDELSFAEYHKLLAAEQSPGWTQAVSREIVGFLRLSVTAAWRHGWQPAELVRHAGRVMGDAHADMAADMVADEMRGYATAMVDDRWAAQVSALGAELWWGNDAEFLPARSARSGEPLRVALELLHLLQHMPVLEQLCPLPGTARAGARTAGGDADERTLARISALLAKAESTEFPEEAEALSARAQELMAKHSIDHALLAAPSGRKDKPAARRLPVDNPYESPKATLLHAVAQANHCRSVWQKAIGMSTVVGFPADLDAVELLYTSLLVQANTAMLREGAKKDGRGRSRTRAFRQSFLVAYAYRIGVRLSQATAGAEREAAAAAPGMDLVPVLKERHEAVDHAIDERFGDGLVYDRGSRATDEEGLASGLAAADLAALHNRDQVSV
jgi:hypothetical protein